MDNLSNILPVVYTYRYMWKELDSSKICFKIVSDTDVGLKSFEESFLNSMKDKLDSFGREYLHQYDCSLIGRFDNLYKKEILK